MKTLENLFISNSNTNSLLTFCLKPLLVIFILLPFKSEAQEFDWVFKSNSIGSEVIQSMAIGKSEHLYVTGKHSAPTDIDPSSNVYNIRSYGTTQADYDGFIIKYDTLKNVIWAKTFYDYYSIDLNHLSLDSDDNVFTTGQFRLSCDFDPDTAVEYRLTVSNQIHWAAFVCKLDSLGQFVFAKHFNGSTEGRKVISDANKDIVVAGKYSNTVDFDPDPNVIFNQTSYGLGDGFVVKLDSNGNFKWVTTFNTRWRSEIYSMDLDQYGNIYVIGDFDDSISYTSNQQHFGVVNQVEDRGTFVAKLDPAGNVVWINKVFETHIGTEEEQIAVGNNGEVYISGVYSDSVLYFENGLPKRLAHVDKKEIFLAKIDSLGTTSWVKSFRGMNDQRILDIDFYDDHLLLAGNTYDKIDMDIGVDSAYILNNWGKVGVFFTEYDLDGNYRWARNIVSHSPNFVSDIEESKSGNIYFAGILRNPSDFDPRPSSYLLGPSNSLGDFYISKFSRCIPDIDTLSFTICQGDTLLVGGLRLHSEKIHREINMNVRGCDSIIYYNLIVDSSYVSNQQTSICEGDSVFIYGKYRKVAGIYSDSLQTVNGCDSLFTTTLMIDSNFIQQATQSICQGDSALIFGKYQSLAGVFTDSLQSTKGCDSILTISLIIENNYSQQYTQSICQGDSVLIFGKYQRFAGVYTDSLQSTKGCDSILTTTLSIDSIDTTIITNSNVLIANIVNANYQWLDCNQNYAIISGEISQSFTVTHTGNYAVEITFNGCKDTSACINIIPVSLEEINSTIEQFELFPNPTKDQLRIKGIFKINSIEIYNNTGQSILKQTNNSNQIDVSDFTPGIYFIRVQTEKGMEVRKFVKQ